MIKYCLDKWNRNNKRLEAAMATDTHLNSCGYEYLVKLVVDYILNDETNGYSDTWDSGKITVIDNGDYQGTQLFIIPNNSYQPCEWEYLMTYVEYGSCGGCDTLLSIQGWDCDATPSETQLRDYMTLCRDLVIRMIKPYNCGWREDDAFKEVTMTNEVSS